MLLPDLQLKHADEFTIHVYCRKSTSRLKFWMYRIRPILGQQGQGDSIHALTNIATKEADVNGTAI